MHNQEFSNEVYNSYKRSVKVLLEKGEEYGSKENRLQQFYSSAVEQGINPCEALRGMASKHTTSIALMCENPHEYTLKQWNEKITDSRNYTFLLDALLRDMGIE